MIMAGPCSLCNAECCREHYITVTVFDILRISSKTGRKLDEFAVFYPLRMLNFDNDTVLEFYDDGYPAEHILALKSHPCIFLEGRRCTIHDFAPYVCRTYPRRINGSFNNRLCPLPAAFLFRVFGTKMPENYAEELDGYKEIVASWNRKKGKNKDCMDFLVEGAKSVLSAPLPEESCNESEHRAD